MFKSIKRFFHNLFWKEKRIVKDDPKRSNFQGIQQKQLDGRGDLKSDEYQTRKAQLLERLGAGEEVPPRLFPLGTVTNVTVDPSNGGRNSPEETKRCREQFAARGLMMSGTAGAFTTSNPASESDSSDKEAGDETYALPAEHVMSQEAASMYRRLCTLKHHSDFQTPEARDNLGSMLSALRSGSWEPGKGKVLDESSPVIQRLLGGGLQRGHVHILSAHTDSSKSALHSANSLQSEVNHLITMDPGKFGGDSHAEVDMVVTKLGDEVDCRVTKVKVIKRRLTPLSKSEKSKMSKRRVKKESKKVIEVSRGKHRG